MDLQPVPVHLPDLPSTLASQQLPEATPIILTNDVLYPLKRAAQCCSIISATLRRHDQLLADFTFKASRSPQPDLFGDLAGDMQPQDADLKNFDQLIDEARLPQRIRQTANNLERLARKAGKPKIQVTAVPDPSFENGARNIASLQSVTVLVACASAVYNLLTRVDKLPRTSEHTRGVLLRYGVPSCIINERYLLAGTNIRAKLQPLMEKGIFIDSAETAPLSLSQYPLLKPL